MKGRTVGIFLLLAIVATGAAYAEPSVPDCCAATTLSSEEASRLEERQTQDLLSTEWGRAFASVESLRTAFARPRPLTIDELQTFRGRQSAELETVVASGAWTVWKRILFFIPDRFLDCVDMVTFGVGIGIGLGAEVHITRWAALGAGAEGDLALFWYYNRNLTPPIPAFALLAAFGPYQAYTIGFAGAGTGWSQGHPGAGTQLFRKSGVFSVNDEMVQEGWSDPYGVGVGWAAEIHPIEIADFVVGLVTFGFVDTRILHALRGSGLNGSRSEARAASGDAAS
ncbi:hypothetical protein JW916_00540, partial [Candidatus Sumerlaeota bacterium]|nr:hypothetical protein [Candidatus Sumerlaeota bacterium]